MIKGYFGGKAPWAKEIISHFPQHRIYVEPFGGGGSILAAKAPICPRRHPDRGEVLNDLNSEVVNVFRVMRDRPDDLARFVSMTPWSREEYEEALQATPLDAVDKARQTLLRFLGSLTPDGTLPCWRNNFDLPRRWVAYQKEIAVFCERLRSVIIECRPALSVIDQYDSPHTLFYCDPPYPPDARKSARRYRFEMTIAQHEELGEHLRHLEGMVVLSGYPCGTYSALYHDWEEIPLRQVTKGLHGKERAPETLWLNPRASILRPQMNLL